MKSGCMGAPGWRRQDGHLVDESSIIAMSGQKGMQAS